MKTIKHIALSLVALASMAGFSSCQDDYTAPELEVPVSTLKHNTTILQLKQTFSEYRETTGNSTLTIPDNTVIHGFVISSDATGNIYQSLVIQDETAAIQFSISRASLWSLYPIGQEIVVDASGLVIGTYGNLIQIGDYYENGGTPQVGRMLYAKFMNQSQLNGLPNDNFKYVAFDGEWPSDRPYVIATTIEETNEMVGNDTDIMRMQSQLVRFQNVHWQDAGEATYAEYEETSRRYILDASANSLMAYNSGYSTFYNQILPEGEGSVEGILSYYGYDGSADNPWQLLLRSTQDVQFGDAPGTRKHPFGVEEVIALDDCGLTAWAEGYIVGALDWNSKPLFGASTVDDMMDDNLLIAPTADCTDIAQCVCVQLPAGSKMRKLANLPDNPDRIGHKLIVNGSFAPYYGLHGILVSNGSLSNFTIEGVDLGGSQGTGVESDPYTVEYILENYAEASASDIVWATGYIVGFFDGKVGAVFGIPDGSADYNGTNVLVASEPDCTDFSQCVYFKCDRNELGLKAHPEYLGKSFKSQGFIYTFETGAKDFSMPGFTISKGTVTLL